MTCTSRTTLRRRRLVAAALALPLSLAMTGTALATGTAAPGASADARTAAATAPDKAGPAEDRKAAPAVKAESKPAPATKTADKPATGATAGAASGKSVGTPTRDSSSDPDKHGTPTEGPLSEPQPLSKADKNGTGANPGETCDHSYCSTRDGSPSGNGVGDGEAKGKPCAGCVGKADNKNPKGQAPDGPTDHNAGYECDRNEGIGQTNPAHTGCTSTGVAPTTPTCPDGSAMPASGKVADCKKSEDKVNTCPDGSAMPASGKVADCKKSEQKVKTCPDGSVMPAGGAKDCPKRSDSRVEQITFCHATGSATNPYVVITTSKQAVVNGHAGTHHHGGRDIIPSFDYVDGDGVTRTFPGQGDATVVATGCTPGGTTPVDGTTPGQAGTDPTVKLCPNGQVMPDGDPANCPTAPPVCPTVMPTVGPVMAGCFPTTATPPPSGTLPIDGLTPGQPATQPVPAGPPAVSPVIVPNTAVLPAVLHAPAARPAAAAAAGVPSTLPFTGTDLALLVELAALLLLAGGGFLAAARRERLARTAA